jgi:hypothetical protein
MQENQFQILEEQGRNFDKTLNWLDSSMQDLMIETKKKDTDIILQAQENNLNKALNLIMNSFNSLTREIRSIKKSNSFDDLKQLQQPPEIKESRRRKPGYPNNNAGKKDVKRSIMIAARDCKDVSDLSTRLQEIYIEEQHLNFGEIKFQYSETEDFLDQCISNNMFPELDTFICPVCSINLGLVEGDDDIRFMKHMEKEHEIRQKKMSNLFPFLLLG